MFTSPCNFLTFWTLKKSRWQKEYLGNWWIKKVTLSAFKYLLSKVKSKGKEIVYLKGLQCKSYLLANSALPINEQRAIFSFRIWMNYLKNNYKRNNQIKYCQCESKINNKHLYDCNELNNTEKKTPYESLFKGRLCELKQIVYILLENQTNMNVFTPAQESNPLSH